MRQQPIHPNWTCPRYWARMREAVAQERAQKARAKAKKETVQ